MRPFPAACPRCDRMFDNANFIEKDESVDGKNIAFIVCQCGYVDRHS